MIETEKFSMACTEVLEILENTEEEDYKKIPTEFLKNLEDNASPNYKSNIDLTKDFNEQDLLPETLDLLACIYRQFWCGEEEKKEFDKIMQENEIKYQKELSEKYSTDKIFSSKKPENIQIEEKTLEVIEFEKKEKFYVKIINFIKSFFKKK